MPPISLNLVFIANALFALVYLIFGLVIAPWFQRRRAAEAEATRSELLERYRSVQEEQREQGRPAENDGAADDAEAVGDLAALKSSEPAASPHTSSSSPENADEESAHAASDSEEAEEEGYQSRVLNDRPDIVTEGPSVLTSIEAPKSEYSALHYVLNTLVMLTCPVAGPLYFCFSWVLKNVVFRKPVDVGDVIFSKARVKPVEEADPEHEMNITPLEEAVSVTDDYHLRTLMLNVLSGDMEASLSSISEALSSDDSESAHYAASYLSDAVNQLRADTQKLYLQILEDEQGSERVVDYAIERAAELGHAGVEEDDREYVRRMLLIDGCSRYLETVDAALDQKVSTPLETEELVRNLQRIGEIFYATSPEDMQPEHYEALAKRLQGIGDRSGADLWIERESLIYQNTLSYHTCRLQVLYARGDREAFFDALDELKNSSVTVDKATLDAIRLFERGREAAA